MKKCLPIFFLFLMIGVTTYGQRHDARSADYIRCGTVESEEARRMANPNLQTNEEFEQWMAQKLLERAESGEERQATYRVPYIVHVVHNGSAVGVGPNLSEAQVNAQMQQTNEDFNRTNADATNTPAAFLPVASSLDIEFVPAMVDPEGNPLAEPGIHRVNGQAEFGISSWTGQAQVNGTLKPATSWDPNLYFNIWTCNLGGGLLGYAQFPEAPSLPGVGSGNGAANTDGIVMAYGTFGSLTMPGSAPPYNLGRTVTHELGHWAGLRHIWGDGGCGVDDFCDDTPSQGSSNGTGSPCTFPGPNSCNDGAGDLADMFQNYMDYSDDVCMNLFTQDQADRMVIVFENSPRRNDLLTSPVWQMPGDIVTASFVTSVTGGCGPLSVAFTNESTAGANVDPLNSWEWDFDVDGLGGASPSTFSGENPGSVVFSNTGTYTVSLTVSNGSENDDYTFEINVSSGGTYDHLNGGTLLNELAANEGGTSGYVGGHNSFGDIAKADYFAEGAAGLVLDYVDYNFAIANALGAQSLTCAIWDDNGGSPGAEIASTDILISDISTGPNVLTRVEFGDLELTGPFYAGIKLNLSDGSEVSLYTNTNGDSPVATAWEQFGDGSWHRFDEPNTSWGWDVALAIYATIACPAPVLPVADFESDDQSVCSGQEVQFTDLSEGNPTSWSWNFGDGNTSTDQNPTHTYATGGNYTVTLTATNDEGSDTETKIDYIAVQTEPSNFEGTASESVICAGESVNLGMTGTFGATYSWEVDGTVIANGASTTVSPTETTTYLAICDNGTCRVTDEVTITVNPLPATPTISVNGDELTATSTSTGSFQWLEDGTEINGATGETYTAPASGDYSVTITDGNGCSSTSDEVSVALEPPVADFNASATTVCEGTEVTFTDLSTNSPDEWSWDFGDGGSSSMQNPAYTFSTPGTWTVELTATNDFGSDTETMSITVEATPTGFTAVATPTEVCAGDDVALSMDGTFGGAYSWYEGATLITTGMNVTVNPTSTTTYTAVCEAVCTVDSDVTVTVLPAPATPTISQDDFTLTATSTSTGTFQWYLNGSEIGGATSEEYTASEDGSYTVTITDANGCVSEFSAATIIANTAVINQILDAAITIYPNPVQNILTVELTNADLGKLRLAVIDVMGRKISETNIESNSTEVNMSNYAKGVYLIRLMNENGEFAIREVVKN